jgi:hypothetical protein
MKNINTYKNNNFVIKNTVFLLILVFLVTAELISYLVMQSQLVNSSIVFMRYDEYIFGPAGLPEKLTDNSFINRHIPIYKDAVIAPATIMIPLSRFLNIFNIPHPLNAIIPKMGAHVLMLIALYYFYRAMFDKVKTKLAVLMTFLVPSFAFFVVGFFYLLGIFDFTKIYRNTPISQLYSPTQYAGIAVFFGLLALGSLIKTKKINLFQVLICVAALYTHPVLGGVYFGIYLFLIILFKIKTSLHYLFILPLGFIPWIFMMSSVAKDYYSVLNNNLFGITEVGYSIFIFLLKLGPYFLILLYLWYTNKKLYSWKWILFFTLFILSLAPEIKFGLIRTGYLFFPLTISIVIILVSGFFDKINTYKRNLLSLFFIVGIINLFVVMFLYSQGVMTLENSKLSFLYKLKDKPYGAVLASSNLSYFIPSVSKKPVLLGICCGLDKQEDIKFYFDTIHGNGSESFEPLSKIKYLLAPCNSTPNLGFRYLEADEKEEYCLWNR